MADDLINPVGAFLGYRLRRASLVSMADVASALQPEGLKITQATILLMVEANPDCRQMDLCRALEIQRANMAPLIAQLRSAGLIESAAIDGRSQAMRLTAKGKRLARRVRELLDREEARLRARFNGEEWSQICALVQRIGAPDLASVEHSAA